MDEEVKEKRRYTNIPVQTKRRIRAMYETGEYTIAQVAEEVKLDKTIVENYLKNHGIEKGKRSEEIQRAAMSKAQSMAEQEATLVASRIRETKEEHYKMAMGLAKLTWQEVVQCKQSKQPLGSIKENLKALESASNTLAKCRGERWAVLGLDKDNVGMDSVPELVLTELTADQIEQIRNFQEDDSLELADEELNRQFAEENENNIVEEGEDD